MGYRGKVREQNRARELRAEAWKLQDIADELQVAKSSVSLWVRDVEFEPRPRRAPRKRGPNKLQIRKESEIAWLLHEGKQRVGQMSEREFLLVGAAIYAGEGGKRDGSVQLTNTNPLILLLFVTWLRQFFDVDESRLRLHLYLHQGLDVDAANEFWSNLTSVPISQFLKPYRAVPDEAIKKAKHVFGCPAVIYSCSRTHRAIMGLVHALLSSDAIPG